MTTGRKYQGQLGQMTKRPSCPPPWGLSHSFQGSGLTGFQAPSVWVESWQQPGRWTWAVKEQDPPGNPQPKVPRAPNTLCPSCSHSRLSHFLPQALGKLQAGSLFPETVNDRAMLWAVNRSLLPLTGCTLGSHLEPEPESPVQLLSLAPVAGCFLLLAPPPS